MADTFINGESNASVRSKLNINAGEINANTAAIIVNAGDIDNAEDRLTVLETDAYTNLYLNAPEELEITAGTPLSPSDFTVKFVDGFTYAGGSLTWNGPDAIIKVDGAVSMFADTPNVLVTISFGKNGVVEEDTNIDRKISTGGDVGAAPVAGCFSMTSGDYLDFFVDVNTSSKITLTKANFTIHRIARL